VTKMINKEVDYMDWESFYELYTGEDDLKILHWSHALALLRKAWGLGMWP